MRLAELAKRPDLNVGPVVISPSRRRIDGPAGSAAIEPIVLQVLLMLVDARGSVVTRDELFDDIWPGGTVGDDSLNRAVAAARRLGEQVAPGTIAIETIPRTGYRLTLAEDEAAADRGAPSANGGETNGAVSRRTVAAGLGALAFAGAAGGGLWWRGAREDRQFRALIGLGMRELAYGAGPNRATEFFGKAMALRPDDPGALGPYSYSIAVRATGGPVRAGNDPKSAQLATAGAGRAGAALDEAVHAANKALAIAPAEPFARLTLNLASEGTLDMAREEDLLRGILADAPRNIHVMRHLWNLLQCAGRSQDSYALIERALAVEPLAAMIHYPRGQLLWILGRNAEAERVLDIAVRYWPGHPFVRFARFNFLAYTGRARAALSMLEKPGAAPQNFSDQTIALWKQTLPAFDDREPSVVSAAIRANAEAAEAEPQLSNQAVMSLSTLGAIDLAFERLSAFFAVKPGGRAASSTAWRFAPWLFTPPLAPMRADPRFAGLCRAIGLSDYWEKRGRGPDHSIAGL